jgi:hypothetical protein
MINPLSIVMGDVVSNLFYGLCIAVLVNHVSGVIPNNKRTGPVALVKGLVELARQEPTFLLLLAAIVWFVACKLANGIDESMFVGAYIVFVVAYVSWVWFRRGGRFAGYPIFLHFLAIAERLVLTTHTLTFFGSTYALTPYRQALITILLIVILLRVFRVKYLQCQLTAHEVEASRRSK